MTKLNIIDFQSIIFILKNLWKDWYEYEKGWYLKIDSMIWGKNSNSKRKPFPNATKINKQKVAIHIIEIEFIDKLIVINKLPKSNRCKITKINKIK